MLTGWTVRSFGSTTCPVGNRCPENSVAPIKCPSGSIAPKPGAEFCDFCNGDGSNEEHTECKCLADQCKVEGLCQTCSNLDSSALPSASASALVVLLALFVAALRV